MSKKSHRVQVHRPPPPVQGQSNQVVHTITQAQWQGPLPPPEALERFNQIIPNGADRIVAMAEAEQRHRANHESVALQARIREARRGQYAGVLLSALCIVGAAALEYFGAHTGVAVALLSMPVMSFLSAIVNRSSAKSEAKKQ
jgi:uncharacterized membrane protein